MAEPLAAAPLPLAHPMLPVPYRVVANHREADQVVTLDVVPDDEAVPEPAPGQFCMLYAPGIGEAPISVSGAPAREGVLRHTIREVGAVTRALAALDVGDPLGVRGPYGRGWPLAHLGGRHLLVVAGGIGLPPLRPVVLHALDKGGPARVAVAIGAREPRQLLFGDDARDWARRGADVRTIVDAAAPGWSGDVGVVTDVLPRLLHRAADTTAMVCGPEVMLRVVARHLADAGVPAEEIHVSVERNMHCGIGHCGHCQLGRVLTCLDGPVLPWSEAAPLLEVRRW